MGTPVKWTVRPGGLSNADHKMIRELADRGWNSNRIAQRIEKHPATVAWFMYSRGLKERTRQPTPRKPYTRADGVLVSPFTPDEDAFIEALRVQQYKFVEIARLANARFGTKRPHNSIQMRLVMLAGGE
jgi:hypothetical protein